MKTEKITTDLQLFGGEMTEECAEAEFSEEEHPEISVEADEPEDQTEAPIGAYGQTHLALLERQAAEVRRTFPDFDLARELENPVFAKMISPDIGIGVEDAYFAVHRKEIREAVMREAAQTTAERIAGAIRSGSRRPSESGGSSQASSVSTFDYSKASKAQREAFKKDLLTRMARGEKVYPTRYR